MVFSYPVKVCMALPSSSLAGAARVWPDLWERGTAGSQLAPGAGQSTISRSTWPTWLILPRLPWGKTSIWNLAEETGERMIGVWPACQWECVSGTACTRICQCRVRWCRPPGISWQAPGQKGRSGFRHSWLPLQRSPIKCTLHKSLVCLRYIAMQCQKLQCTLKLLNN